MSKSFQNTASPDSCEIIRILEAQRRQNWP
jgi:hypothetical protein